MNPNDQDPEIQDIIEAMKEDGAEHAGTGGPGVENTLNGAGGEPGPSEPEKTPESKPTDNGEPVENKAPEAKKDEEPEKQPEKPEEADNIEINLGADTKVGKEKEPEKQPEQPVVDLGKLLQEKYGLTEQQITEKLDIANQSEANKDKSPYKSKLGELFDEYSDKGLDPQVILDVIKVDTDKLDPLGVMRYAMKLENPSMSDEKIELLLKDEYKISEGDEFSEREKIIGEAKLEKDAGLQRPKLAELKQKALQSDDEKNSDALAKAETIRKDNWTKRIPSLAREFKSLELKLPSGNTMTWNVKEDQVEGLEKTLQAVAANPNMKFDENTINIAAEVMKKQYIYDNLNDIVVGAAIKMRSLSNEDWAKVIHNPSAIDKQPPEHKEREATTDEQVYQQIAKAEGLELVD